MCKDSLVLADGHAFQLVQHSDHSGDCIGCLAQSVLETQSVFYTHADPWWRVFSAAVQVNAESQQQYNTACYGSGQRAPCVMKASHLR